MASEIDSVIVLRICMHWPQGRKRCADPLAGQWEDIATQNGLDIWILL